VQRNYSECGEVMQFVTNMQKNLEGEKNRGKCGHGKDMFLEKLKYV
jgi:hypothetical protein